ncbi:3-isopropylmalate dehydrogenase [Halopolyspora algeriensis]|uniref:3-isopropylmalate dehydrogenase n=1 Tax=Halopolyspora algeriensis TaxID=1500506 RepID=A0A368VG95_9ACTN|nr:isocitrate/isopropylmalate family dehydrogenase [Halopolyspora algeriensis]RCW39673.1 3-isopropylmalate dehydrogenase [Halopolyspora algeriensis]TQM54034.1 3-isopropylmalate dehydrogenase [Halopolyspora algeriensis]
MNSARTYDIGLVPGDGVGPEVVDSAVAVLRAAAAGSFELRLTTEDAGANTYRRTGTAMDEDTVSRIRSRYDGVLKGPVGLPEVRHPDGTEAGVLGGILRSGLDAYANVRPVRGLPGAGSPLRDGAAGIDYVIVRENTEGLYLSRGLGVGNDRAVSDQLMMTRQGIERIVRFAFELARQRGGAPADGVRRVTCVDKSNVLRSYAFFRSVFDEVAAEYPDVERDYRYADAAGHDLITEPGHFDVLVMENFLGDVLSDVAAATVGGLGMCPAGNVGRAAAYFEPVHGSAPDLAGTDRANPAAQILAAALMAEHLGEHRAAARMRAAVESAFADEAIRLLPSGAVEGGLRAATRAVVDRIGA